MNAVVNVDDSSRRIFFLDKGRQEWRCWAMLKNEDDANHNDKVLWTGESMFCRCSHHLVEHKRVYPLYFLLRSNACKLKYRCEKCEDCAEFTPYGKVDC